MEVLKIFRKADAFWMRLFNPTPAGMEAWRIAVSIAVGLVLAFMAVYTADPRHNVIWYHFLAAWLMLLAPAAVLPFSCPRGHSGRYFALARMHVAILAVMYAAVRQRCGLFLTMKWVTVLMLPFILGTVAVLLFRREITIKIPSRKLPRWIGSHNKAPAEV